MPFWQEHVIDGKRLVQQWRGHRKGRLGGLKTGCITIKAENHFIGFAFQQLQLMPRDCRSHAAHGIAKPILVHRHHIKKAFHHNQTASIHIRAMQGIENFSLLEKFRRCLGTLLTLVGLPLFQALPQHSHK